MFIFLTEINHKTIDVLKRGGRKLEKQEIQKKVQIFIIGAPTAPSLVTPLIL